MNALTNLSKQNPLLLAGGVVLVVGALYYFARKAAGDVADAVQTATAKTAETIADVATGNNAVTRDTPYEGTGLPGTIGAATNDLLGGVPQRAGEYLGGWVYDLLHSDQ